MRHPLALPLLLPTSLLVLACGWLASGCSPATPASETEQPTARLTWVRGGDGAIDLDGAALGRLRRLAGGREGGDGATGGGWALEGDGVRARLDVVEEPVVPGHPYPRRIVTEGELEAPGSGGVAFRDAYTVLAPPGPLPIEGFGLEVADDAPGTNREEHAKLRRWLGEQGLPADTTPFEALHEKETGRQLRVWYEISGRRVDGAFSRLGPDGETVLARTEAPFRSEDGGLKIHHQRPGENGRFDYHRQSLERAVTLAASADGPALHAHECGCYGYAIAADFMTLGSTLYHVEADWLDDRVAAEFFLGLESRDTFPWIGLGDRRRMRDLARRARAWILKDAEGRPFAEFALELPDDPPSPALGPIAYAVDRIDVEGERTPLARIAHDDDAITIAFFGGTPPHDALLQLDRLLAAMPAQVMRGDGLRDSHLGEIELLVDAVRLLEAPGPQRLADLVSDVDILAAPRKVEALLGNEPERFAARAEALPPEPIPGPGAAGGGAGRDRQARRAP